MKTKVISPQQYNELPRTQKRKMQRDLEKKGLEMPEIRERVQLIGSVDKELFLKAGKVLDRNNLDINRFLDLALQNLILSEK